MVAEKICPKCKRANLENAIFCSFCRTILKPIGHRLNEFPVWAVVVFHFLTLGLFGPIWINLFHGKMPPLRHDDPTGMKAVGFLFIPIFNFYWIFFTHLRLCDRLNELRRKYSLSGNVPKGLTLLTCIFLCIPYVNFVGFFILYPIYAAIVQSKVNELVRRTLKVETV